MAHILLTRPIAQALETAEKLKILGHSACVEPLLTIEHLNSPRPTGEFGGILITSSNCLSVIRDNWTPVERSQLPLLATGAATASAARHMGFTNSQHVSGSALELVAKVPDWMEMAGLGPDVSLLYPCAETTARPVVAQLTQLGIHCQPWPVYRAVASKSFTPAAQLALQSKEFDGVLLYSGRTAHTFVQLMAQSKISMHPMRFYALSRDIVDVLPREVRPNALFPSTPNEAELLNLIVR